MFCHYIIFADIVIYSSLMPRFAFATLLIDAIAAKIFEHITITILSSLLLIRAMRAEDCAFSD